MGEGKFVGYFELLQACDEPGCPVCRCAVRDSRRYLDALLYEQVTDVDTRRALRASWAFCNWHTWMLLEIEHPRFGAAIIYEDILGRVLTRTVDADGAMTRHRRWLSTWLGLPVASKAGDAHRRRARCPACVATGEAERRYLDTLARLGHEGDLLAAYSRSDGLCVPHLVAVREQGGDQPGTRALVDRTREKWRKVVEDLGSFVAKHDYRNREPYTEPEAASCERASEILAGARGMFGNDLHARWPGATR
jgi:hypothetical protein